MNEVKNLRISENSTYSGEVISDGFQNIPNGMGIMKFENHSEIGRFKNGVLKGLAYINFHDWMCVGMINKEAICGWGLKVGKGKFAFGIFENSKIKVNLTPLVSIFWSKAMEEANHFNRSATYVRKNGDIFVGAPQYLLYGAFGFHFLKNGEVFVGRCDYKGNGLTGNFLHFDLDFNITKGYFKDGKLVREIDNSEFIRACEVFVNHKYIDFNINMNYNPNNFLFGEKKLLHIVEIGKTPTNIIVKANIGRLIYNRYESQGGVNENTIWFMYPKSDEYLEERLMNIAKGENPWIPNFSEYCVEFYNDFREAKNSHQVVYKHISCFDENVSYNLDLFDNESFSYDNSIFEDNDNKLLELIPIFNYKKRQLVEQWREGGWNFTYLSVKDYIKSLAETYDVNNFFGWLFDDTSLYDIHIWNLPQEHMDAYFQFLDLFPDL